MSPKKKSRPSTKKPTHVRDRHGASTTPPDPPADPKVDARDAACRMLTDLVERLGPDGAHELIVFAEDLADRDAASVVEELASAPAAAPEPAATVAPLGFGEWSAFGTELAKRPHRLALALRVARAAAGGGAELTSHEEDQIAAWFVGVVDLAIERTGGPQPGGFGGDDNAAASAIWSVLMADAHRDPHEIRPARCPSVHACPSPGEPGFIAGLRAAAAGYARTAVAGASDAEVDALASLLVASDATLETYRPFNGPFGSDETNAHAAVMLEPALASLVKRRASNAELCSAVAGYASGWAQLASEHAIPPVARIGLIAWLAKVALAPAPTTPPAHQTPEGALQELLAEDAARRRGILQEGVSP